MTGLPQGGEFYPLLLFLNFNYFEKQENLKGPLCYVFFKISVDHSIDSILIHITNPGINHNFCVICKVVNAKQQKKKYHKSLSNLP